MRKEAGEGGREGKKGEWKRPTTNERRRREGLHHHSVGPSLLSGVSFSSPPSLSLAHSEGPPPTQRGGRYNPRKGGGGKCCRWDRGRSMLGYYRESSSPPLLPPPPSSCRDCTTRTDIFGGEGISRARDKRHDEKGWFLPPRSPVPPRGVSDDDGLWRWPRGRGGGGLDDDDDCDCNGEESFIQTANVRGT